MKKITAQDSGFVLPLLLVTMLIVTVLIGSSVTLIAANLNIVGNNVESQKAFNIAEAGVNYYLWHLSHNSTDFKDGQSTPTTPDASLGYGPYVHDYIDDNAVSQGTYTLWIKPQGGGSTVMTVRSIGKVAGSHATRTVEAQLGAPSYASYAVTSDTALWFGPTETANGPVHSNQGIRMDGANTTDVTSGSSAYVPPSNLGGDGNSHPGVWCNSSVTTPVNCSTRSKTDWRYPVPTIDFNQVTGSLCTIKKTAFLADSNTAALASGASPCTQTPTTRTATYLPQRSTTGTYTASKGYLIELNADNTYNLSQVNAETDTNATYQSALTLVGVANNIPIDASGVIFAEDNVWVRTNSTYHGRVTIASGRLATSSATDIVIADDVLYSTKNGTDAIGLIAEDSVFIAPYAIPQTGAFNFEIDAAMIAQSGVIEYPDVYRSNTNRCTRGWNASNQTFTFYGSVSTRTTWTWTWIMGGSQCGDAVYQNGTGYVTGIQNNTSQYDYTMYYAPPPNFPITSSYNILGWREVVTNP